MSAEYYLSLVCLHTIYTLIHLPTPRCGIGYGGVGMGRS